MIIAIDGPAASGKGTLAKRLAAHYGFRHLDTGVIYRAVAHALLTAGSDLQDEAAAVRAAQAIDPGTFENPALKSQKVGTAASVISAIPRVREVLVEFQRQFAASPPGAVLDSLPADLPPVSESAESAAQERCVAWGRSPIFAPSASTTADAATRRARRSSGWRAVRGAGRTFRR